MEFAVLARFGLLLVRPGTLVMAAPAIGGTHLPAQVKIGFTVLLALGLVPSVAVQVPPGEVALTLVIAREAVIGLALAFVVRALIAGAELAGQLSGLQIGFSYGATIDPQSGVRNTMLATLYGSLATLGFLAINGHHAVLRALVESYSALPVGTGHVDESIVDAVCRIFGLVLVIGTRLAAPIVVVLLIVELAVGLISRASPALGFMVIGFPIRTLIGLVVLGLLIPTIPAVTNSLLGTALQTGARLAEAFR